MEKTDIDKRIIEYITYLIDLKICKSEAEYLRFMGMASSKISEVRKGKVSFRPDEIRNILIDNKQLNAHWIMTGEGNMIMANDKENSNSLIKDTIDDLLSKNAELNREIGRLEEKLVAIKKRVPEEGNVTCAIASGSDLEL